MLNSIRSNSEANKKLVIILKIFSFYKWFFWKTIVNTGASISVISKRFVKKIDYCMKNPRKQNGSIIVEGVGFNTQKVFFLFFFNLCFYDKQIKTWLITGRFFENKGLLYNIGIYDESRIYKERKALWELYHFYELTNEDSKRCDSNNAKNLRLHFSTQYFS